MTRETLINLIRECCDNAHLSYSNLSPKQVSPGIWQFNAVEMDDDCNRHGHCRQMRYYAMVTNERVQLV